ncbi:MAG: hypothetical protein ACR2P0_13625 [Acidimicrobiales bacterium]
MSFADRARASRRRSTRPAIRADATIDIGAAPPIDRLFATIVEASFDLIEELGSISLALYLHAPHDDQPQFFVRSPTLSTLSPTQTFRLMHTTTMLSNGRKPSAAFRHGDLDGHYVRSTGTHSDGLYVFGGIQNAEVAQRIVSVTRAFSRVLHQFHLDDGGDLDDIPTVVLENLPDRVRARATIRENGEEVVGSSTAEATDEAVSRAVMQALAPGYSFDEVRTLDLGNRSAVLAVLRDERRYLRLGLAISAGDVVRTTALATRRAITQIDPS